MINEPVEGQRACTMFRKPVDHQESLSPPLRTCTCRCPACSYYVYVFVVCGRMLQSGVQVALYLGVYFSIVLMMLWALVQTLRTPVARVPPSYRLDAETAQRLQEATPYRDGRFQPDQSSLEQVERQMLILSEWAERRRHLFAETDRYGRIR